MKEDRVLAELSEIKVDLKGVATKVGNIENSLSRIDERLNQCSADRGSIHNDVNQLYAEIYGKPGDDEGLKERTTRALDKADMAQKVAIAGAASGGAGLTTTLLRILGLI